MIVPPFPLVGDPGEWPELVLMAATVLLESEGEPEIGQIAVAHTVVNIAEAEDVSIPQAILGRDLKAWGDGRAYERFSCFNDDYQERARARLAACADAQAARAWKAAAAGYWRLTPDPSMGAVFYLNIPLTRKIRGGTLPAWFKEANITMTHGRHTFLRA